MAVAQAVSPYLEQGQSGWGVAGEVAVNDDATALGIFGGYSFDGFVDAGLGVVRYGFDSNNFNGADVSAIGIGPGVNLIAARQKPGGLPVSIIVGASFQYLMFSSDDLDAVNVDISGWSLNFGGAAYRRFNLGSIAVQPQAGLYLIHRSGTVETPFGDSTDSEQDVGVSLHGNFMFRVGGTQMVADPFLNVDDENLTVGAMVGVVLGR